MITIGIAGGLAAAGAGIGIANVTGDTTATIGNVAVGGTSPVGHLNVTADSIIHASSLAVSVQGGGLALSAAVALVTVAGTTSATSGAHGSAGSGGITVHSTGDHSATVDAINIAIGAIAIGATVAIAKNERAVLATMSSTAAMSTTGAVLVAADSHDAATANTPGGGGGGISINVMVPIASVSGATRARVDGDITGSSSIEVRATGENVATATALVVGLAVIGISGAVADATIESDADVEAIVGSGSSLTSSGTVLVDARHVEDGNKVTATATIGQGGSIASFAVAVALAETHGAVLARLDGDVTTTSGAPDSVKVNANGKNNAIADTLIISGGLFSGAGAGSLAEVGSGADVEARVGATTTISSNGPIVVSATGDSDADANSQVATGGLAAISVSLPKATIGGTTRAEFSGDVTQGDSLDVTAAGTYDAVSEANPVTIGLISAAATVAEATIESGATVEAHIGPAIGAGGSDRPDIHVGTGAVTVSADATMNATATADSVNIGGLSITLMFPEARVDGATRAFVRDGTAIEAGSLHVKAGHSGDKVTYRAEAKTRNISASFAGGTGAEAEATVNGVVEAFVGAPAGTSPASAGTATIDLSGTMTVEAWSDLDAIAIADAGAGGGISVSVMLPSADVAGTTTAYIGQAIRIEATGVNVLANGDYNAEATSWLLTIAALSANAAAVTATVSGTVDAHVGSAAGTAPSANVARLNLTGPLNVDADASMTATPQVKKALGIALVDVTVLLPVAELKGTVRAYVGEGVDIDATALHVEASAPSLHAIAAAASLGFEALAGIGVIDADATNDSIVEAFVGAHRTIDASNVTTRIDTHGGAVDILVDTELLATATAETGGFAGLVKIGVVSPTARVTGYVGGYIRDGVDLTGGTLGLKVGNTGPGERVVIAAVADTDAVNVGGVLAGSVAIAEAIAGGTVEAFLGAASGRIRGGDPTADLRFSGAVDVIAASDMDATATIVGHAVSGGFSLSVLIPTAWVAGATRAYAGDGTNLRSSSLNLLADSDVKAKATTEQIAVGLLGAGNGGSAEAIVVSVTEAFLGERHDTTRTTQADVQIRDASGNAGTVSIHAISVSVAEAKNDGLAAALLAAVSVLTPTAKLSGSTRAYIGPRTTVLAANVDILAKDVVARAQADVESGAGSAFAVSVIDSDAKVSRTTEAFVGHHADLNLGSGDLTLTAWSPQVRAVTTSRGTSVGVIASVSVFSADASIGDDTVSLPVVSAPGAYAGQGDDYKNGRPTVAVRSVTRAYIGDDASVDARNVTLDADSDALAEATTKYAGISGFVGVKVAETLANTNHDTEAWIGNRAAITLSGALSLSADDKLRATPTLESFDLAGLLQISVFKVHSNLAGDLYAGIGDGTSVSATGVLVHAKGDHAPATEIETVGAGGLGAITSIDASAKDNSTVTVRIGPDGAPADTNDPTSVSATGSGGIRAEALLDSTVIANSDLTSISFGLSAGFATIEANQLATVQAIVGQSAQLSGASGGITIDADHDGVTWVDASSLGVAFGVSVAIVRATANHNATVKALVKGNASLTASGAGGIAVNADHNDDYVPAGPGILGTLEGAGATANNSNFAALGAVGDSVTKAHAKVVVETTVEAGATLNAPGGAITVTAGSRNVATASLKSVSAAIVRIDTGKATPLAEGSTTVSFYGNVGSIGTPGAATLLVQASGFTYSFGSMNASGGGVVSVGTGDASARSNPTLTVNFGAASSVINVSGTIDVIGTQATDADATAKSATGGLVEVNNYNTSATATPTVTVNVNDTTSVTSGSTLTIKAVNGAVPTPVSDGTVLTVEGDDGVDGNYITLTINGQAVPVAHGLGDGATITYQGGCCSLQNNRTYGVIRRDANTIQLGARFDGVLVDPATDIITFGAPGEQAATHGLSEGEIVWYYSEAGAAIPGLTHGTRYRVTVVDAYRIRLLPFGESPTSTTVNGSSGVDGDAADEKILADDHPFSDDQVVVYTLPVDHTFKGNVVEIAIDGDGVPVTNPEGPPPAPDGSNTIWLGRVAADGESIIGHDYETGDEVVYGVDIGGLPIPGLSDGVHYFVIKVDDYRIQLAETYCKAFLASDKEPGCVIDFHGSGSADDEYQDRVVKGISRPAATALNTNHTFVLASRGPIGGLRNGGAYFVVNANDDDFQLSTTLGGSAIDLTATGGSGHRFRREGLDITGVGNCPAGQPGCKKLVVDLSDGTGGAFLGVGGAASFAVPSSGAGRVTASTTGASGGFIDVGSPDAIATVTNSTTINVKSGASLTGTNVVIETEGRINVKALGKSDGIGFVALASSTAAATATNNSTITIESGAAITARGDLRVTGFVTSDVEADADSDKAGFIGAVEVFSSATESHQNVVTVAGTLTAGDELTVEADTVADAYARAYADADGFGADGDANDDDDEDDYNPGARVGQNGSETRVTIKSDARLRARAILLTADTSSDAEAYSESDCDAVGADCDARADVRVNGTTEVELEARSTVAEPQVDGTESIWIEASQSKMRAVGKARSDCSCLGGDTDSRVYVIVDTLSLVTGAKDAMLRTALLNVRATSPDATTTVVRDSSQDGGAFDGGGSGDGASESDDPNVDRDIDWEATTILLGEPNPKIHIDQNGVVVELVNITGHSDNGALALGGTVAGDIVLDDILYDAPSNVFFFINELNGSNSSYDEGPAGQIYGNAAIFDFQETWDFVTILNESQHDLYVMDIDVVKPPSSSTIQIDVASIPDGGDPATEFRTLDVGEGGRFHFEIIHSYIETVVTITADQSSGTDWDVFLNGVIHNAIGSTLITASNGDIEYSSAKTNPGGYANGSDQLIRTNVLHLDALGSIGFHTSPTNRIPVNVELIESDYTDDGEPYDPVGDAFRRTPDGTFTSGKPILTRLIVVTATAGDDVVLNVASHRHADATRAAADDFVITFGPVTAGDDIDIFVGDSFDRATPGGPGTVHIHRAENGGDLSPHDVNRFWRPDCALPQHGGDPCPYYELANFATGDNPVLGNYLFAPSAENYPATTVGGSIASGDLPTGDTAYLTAGDFVSVRHLTSGPISYTAIVDADSDGNGTGSVILLTTDFVNALERLGNLQVDDISSSGGDVTLWALGRILDWEDDAQTTPDPIAPFTDATPTTGTDVRGVDITMFAGLGGSVGGIGNAGNYLEIDVAVTGTGSLKAYDIHAASTPGIFVAETDGDLRVGRVWTTNDVSMYTIDGDIVDANADSEVDVLGETIDLDANDFGGDAASIGSSDNDLDIDSSREGALEDVSLEADDSIFVTEADAKVVHSINVTDAAALDTFPSLEADPYSTLRLVLARAWTGDIRLTVREEVDLPEDDDLALLQSGGFQRAEDELLAIPNGTIIARLGYVLLRVGDDVDTHQNSQVLAGESIDVYGDAAAAALVAAERDPGYGTDIVLRGRIVAGCITPGDLSCQPDPTPLGSLATVWLTQIWGYDDVDRIELGDETGLPTAASPKTSLGDPGYIFLGSKTIARGSDSPITAGDAAHDPSIADGEDQFVVWYLQSMDVVSAPAQLADPSAPAAGHSLTLDGQADTDYYAVYTTGSHTSYRNYVVNVLDSGAPNDGVDELAVHGVDNLDPAFNGYLPGTVTRAATDDIFLLRATKCIDTEAPYDVSGAVPSICLSASAQSDHPAFVALLHGDTSPDGGIGGYRSRLVGDEVSSLVQRVNYDAALNGRLTVFGKGGNDYFGVDDNSAITTLDGGAGNDVFQVGQIFGAKRDEENGGLLPNDTFPVLIATTRGWLSPGTHAPLVATGGTGNDEFIVYSNQAELRLEGDDDNDLFIVRAFALAAVCDTDADGDMTDVEGDATRGCDFGDIDLEADPDTGLFPVDTNSDGVCDAAENPGYDGEGWTGFRKDVNGDDVCNKADAHITGAKTFTTAADPTKWEDDVIPLDADGVARPIIGLGFSTARPLDIRAGGGEDEVSYNVNAPVSVDGGTGFDKLVVLGTEFADDIVISVKGIFGAGLNVRYDGVEVVEVDGLEGDDEFFVLSTKFGVAYRVIGGLGSDTINVASDVVEDVITRELEGISGTIDHRVASELDKLYDGLPVDGIDYNLATPDLGVVVVTETGAGTSVREGGSVSVPTIDKYSINLAADPGLGKTVWITISAARSAQEEADDAFSNPEPTATSDSLADGNGDSIWLCTGSVDTDCDDPSEFKRFKWVNGQFVDENNRALVFTFTGGAGGTWAAPQFVYVYAVDDPRSEGDRVVVVQHSTKSDNPAFDQLAVRNVEVSVRDNDTPGVYVTQVTPGLTEEDERTIVIEGFDFGGTYTGLEDELLIQLQMDPGADTIRVKLILDAASQQAIELDATDPLDRWQQWSHDDADPLKRFTYYTIVFDHSNWDVPVRVAVRARADAAWEDPQTAVLRIVRDDTAGTDPTACFPASGPIDLDTIDYAGCDFDGLATDDADETYVFPNIRSGTGITAIDVRDDETADVIAIESGVDTVVEKCGNSACTAADGDGDWYTIRLTKRPVVGSTVDVAILTDGMVDVVEINGVATPVSSYQVIGGQVATRLFVGKLAISADGLTITRANGSELGSFVDEGFQRGALIRISVGGVLYDAQVADTATAVTDLTLTLALALPVAARGYSTPTTLGTADAISLLSLEGYWEGAVGFVDTSGGISAGGWQLVRADLGSFLGDGFLEGQWVEVCVSDGAGNCVGTTGRYKIAIIRGDNDGHDEKLEFRSYVDLNGVFHLVDDLSAFGASATVLIRRIAPVATFTDSDWFEGQRIELRADVGYVVPITRQGVKVFPVQTHGLWKLQGPLAVEGGVTGADRSLQLGLKLPGEKDAPLFAIGNQPPESKQIDVLNIFNDGSKADGSGVLTSTSLTGFGLPEDLDFGPSYSSGNAQTFGEPAIFPGGISFGTVQFVDGTFQTNGAKSTIEVVNFLGGSGNDRIDVQGTIDPDDAVKLTGSVIVTPSATGVDVTRSAPFDWKAQGFLVGQPVHISGLAGTWIVSGFSDSFDGDTVANTVMHLTGTVVTGQPTTTSTVAGVTTDGYAFGGALTRTGGSWVADGFALGQQVTIQGKTGSWQVVAISPDGKTLLLANGPALADVAVGTAVTLSRTTPALRTLVADDVPVQANVPITIVGGEFGGYVTRTDGGSWLAAGFQEGQLVRIQGLEGSWRVRRIEGPNGQTLRLERGAVLPTITTPTTRLVYWPGPHGGLTVVHGGGNTALRIEFELDSTATTVTRLDGLSWIGAGFSIGQRVQVEGDGATRTITSFASAACPYDDPFPGCGLDSTMVLSPDTFGDPVNVAANLARGVHVAEAGEVTTTASMNVTVQPTGPLGLPTSTLTCAPGAGNCFAVVGEGGTVFEIGMQVTVTGLAGPWTVVSVSPTAIVLQGAALAPTYAIVGDVTVWTPRTLTVTGRDADRDGGTRMGGDTIVVCNTGVLVDASKPCRGASGTDALAGPGSPLVVYGDTSQDGVWYGGHGYDVKGYEFGPKPYDPFWKIPDGENEDDEWIFPLADPYDFAGNDVIDASGLFAWISCDATCSNLPTVGFTAYGGAGDDLIIGSQAGDHLAGGSGDDTILGLRGVDHVYGDSGINVDILTRGLTVTSVNASPAPTLDNRNPAGDQTIKPVPSANADDLVAGRDVIYGEGSLTYVLGRDTRIAATTLGSPQVAYDDVIFGDHGIVIQQTGDTNQPDPRLQKIQTTSLASIRLIESRAYQNGADDVIFGNLGRDVIVGGAGNDMADGDEADDMVFGDNAFLLRRVDEPQFPAATDYAGPIDITSGRFQALCGTLMYSRTDRPNVCSFGNPVGSDTSGLLLVNGVWQSYRDPDSPGIDAYPWWAEYLVDFDDEDPSHQFHSFDVQLSVDDPTSPNAKGAGSFGNDYLAGGQAHDLVFGQMGDDVIQGDGGIESAFAGISHAGASRSPDGCANVGGGIVCDYVGDLDLVPSFEAATDGEDYIEGGGGSDIVFGGLGQDDILGGSSDFFGLEDETLSLVGQTVELSGLAGTWTITGVSGGTLTLSGGALPTISAPRTVTLLGTNRVVTGAAALVGTADGGTLTIAGFGWAALGFVPGEDRRPDGHDLLFGGAGTQDDRNQDVAFADGTPAANRHARDADAIVGDNGRIIRIVGTNSTPLTPADADDQRYVRFVYDDYANVAGYDPNAKLVVRGVHMLDYTPGGPDFRPDLFFAPGTEAPLCSSAADDATGECSTPLPTCEGNIATTTDAADLTAHRYTDIGGGDEIHGESSDDTIYGGCGNDVLYGDAQDDDLIGGWGGDWISGGTGSDGVLGDDGRIFTSRNNATVGEPLYGVAPLLATDPDDRASNGNVLNEFIYTPGQVQTATINVAGELKKEVDLTPYNLGPNDVAGHFQIDVPLYDANNSDDVIFGGFDDDFLHGGSGDDAIGGGEALPDSYVQHFAANGTVNGVVRTDWTRPLNPGNLLLFGADFDPWLAPKPFAPRLGEFFLYDEYDPRRAIVFDSTGETWGCTAYSPSGKTCTASPPLAGFPYQYFLNLLETTKVVGGTVLPVTEGRETGLSCVSTAPNGSCLLQATVNTDGDDVLYGDLGNDWLVGGSGKDEIWGGWGNDLMNADDILTTNGSLNDTTDTHGTYEDRAFGGAGIDILIGNTGGDRLIDWVGEHNSYLVPFSPFGIATVSRQVMPWLPEFLYALSAGSGADPTRDTDTGRPAARNGEFEGELGLIIQQDHGYWQQQTGAPTDPQPGNIPGGKRDVLRGADFNNGQMEGFATDSGSFAVEGGALRVTAASQGLDAAAVFYHDQYLPIYFEIVATVAIDKAQAGWEGNAYVIFDYFSPTDFKFVGINQKTNKVEMGQRTATGWHVVAQSPLKIWENRNYQLLVAINGTAATVVVDNKNAFTFVFAPRVIDGETYGLNKGMVGFGSQNSRGYFDNITIQILPPQITLDYKEDFQDGDVHPFTPEPEGAWSVVGGRYTVAAPAPGQISSSLFQTGVQIRASSYLELTVSLRTTGIAGFVFDRYSADDYKFVALDVTTGRVLIGHASPRSGYRVDLAVARTLTAGTDYTLQLVLKGTTLSVVVNGQFVVSFAYNGIVVDGLFGLAAWSGTTSFDAFRLRTDDPAWTTGPNGEPSTTLGGAPFSGSSGRGSSESGDSGGTGPPGNGK